METNIKVSIILTSHNRPHYLQQAIDSVLNQTIPNIELIVIDDYSTVDGIGKVLYDAQKKDSRVKAYRTNYNVDNISVLWNIGIDKSTGEYIALLDDDNKKFPSFCERMSGFLDSNTNYDAVACYAQIMKNETLLDIFDRPKYMTKYNIREGNYVDSGCMMFRRSVIDKIGWFDERLTTSEDWDYVKRIELQTNGFGIIDESLVYYRWHDTNRMNRRVALGDIRNSAIIKYKKNYDKKINVLLFSQDVKKLTLSQRDVLIGMRSALNTIEFVNIDYADTMTNIDSMYDIVIVFAPFSLDIKHIERAARYGVEIVHFHIEDPQAVNENYIKMKHATYVFSNDISACEQYKEAMNYRAGFCPSISFDDINLKISNFRKKKGIIFYGYGYESRKEFISLLKPKLKKTGFNIKVVGGGWGSIGDIGELSQQDSLDLMVQSEIVILHSRKNTDLGGSENDIVPRSIVRGYFEAASGSLVMIDSCRNHNKSLDEIICYDNIDDLISKIKYYMKYSDRRDRIGRKAQKEVLSKYTYRHRVRQMLNIVRSQRFNSEIK